MHYLVPKHLAKKGRLKKRGTKIHICQDHLFMAKHIKRYINLAKSRLYFSWKRRRIWYTRVHKEKNEYRFCLYVTYFNIKSQYLSKNFLNGIRNLQKGVLLVLYWLHFLSWQTNKFHHRPPGDSIPHGGISLTDAEIWIRTAQDCSTTYKL